MPNIESGAYPVTVAISYGDEAGYTYASTETVGIKVLAPTPTVKPQAGKPQIVIESFTAEPQPLPGGTFTLTLTLHNSGTGAARNVVLTRRRAEQLRRSRHGQRDGRREYRLAADDRRGNPADRGSDRQGRRQPASHHPGLRQRRGRACVERPEYRHPGGSRRGRAGDAGAAGGHRVLCRRGGAADPRPTLHADPADSQRGDCGCPACDVDLGQTERRQRERAHRTARHRQHALSGGDRSRRAGRGGQSVHRRRDRRRRRVCDRRSGWSTAAPARSRSRGTSRSAWL